MKKKVLGILLVIVLSIGVLTGCDPDPSLYADEPDRVYSAYQYTVYEYQRNGHTYLVFTRNSTGLFVIEEK